MKNSFTKKIVAFILVAVFAIILVSCKTPDSALPANGDGVLTAMFLDVGQGDCELFYLPDGKVMLIDAGDNATDDALIDYLKSRSITKIDYLVATHPHADHIGGMSEVIKSFEIGEIFAPKIQSSHIPTTKTYEDFLLSVKEKGLKITAATAGEILFSGEDYKAECLAPNGDNYTELNDYSVAVKITYGIHSFLLTGDAEEKSEDEMLSAGYDLSCHVLKLGHHGSSSSSSAKFLKAASPKYAVICCGADNKYGHPHKKTLALLKELKGLEATLRTDNDKTVVFTADGKTEEGLKYTTQNQSVAGKEE